jgi:hypothetical protein
MKYLIPCLVLSFVMAAAAPCRASIINQVGGTYDSWASSWTAISGLNDPSGDATASFADFVGDGYYAMNSQYYMFRMQIALSSFPATPPAVSYLIMINLPGGTTPDYAIAWDAAMDSQESNHGLEMMVYGSSTGGKWSDLKFNDIDGNSGTKGTIDINGGARNPVDGYLRTVDGADSGTGYTYIDFAISKNYLNYLVSAPQNYNPALADINNWDIQFGSITASNGNDHQNISGDVAGGLSLSGTITDSGFANVADALVPEPGTFMLMGSGLLGLLGYRRRGSLLAYFRS